MYNITNLLKNILGISWRILLICKLEIMWFWYACNVHIDRVHVKYLWVWETNWTCTAMLPRVTLLSFKPTVVRMSLTSSYRPACVICVCIVPCFLATQYCSPVKLVNIDVTKYKLCCIITVYSLRQTCYVYVSITVMCPGNNNGENGLHKRQS
jgi:hypothetical protein